MKFLIIIPTYNEEDNIYNLLNSIFEYIKDADFSVLIVDDSPSEATINEIKRFNHSNVKIIKRKEKSGLASAYTEGFKYGLQNGYDALIEFDADFSHNPSYLPQMIEKLHKNDLVIGSRNVKGGKTEGWGIARNLISKGGSIYSRLILNCPIKDLTGGFNGWRKEILNKIDLDKIISKGYSFQVEMKYLAYLKNAIIDEFPITFKDRVLGESKMDKNIFIEALINVIKLRIIYGKKNHIK